MMKKVWKKAMAVTLAGSMVLLAGCGSKTVPRNRVWADNEWGITGRGRGWHGNYFRYGSSVLWNRIKE